MKKPGDPGDHDPNSGVAVHVPWRRIVEECELVEDVLLGGWNDCTPDRFVDFNPYIRYWTKRKAANDNGRSS